MLEICATKHIILLQSQSQLQHTNLRLANNIEERQFYIEGVIKNREIADNNNKLVAQYRSPASKYSGHKLYWKIRFLLHPVQLFKASSNKPKKNRRLHYDHHPLVSSGVMTAINNLGLFNLQLGFWKAIFLQAYNDYR